MMTTDTPVNVSRRAASHGFTCPVHVDSDLYPHVRHRLDAVLAVAAFAAAAVRHPGESAPFTHELTHLAVVVGDGPSITIREATA